MTLCFQHFFFRSIYTYNSSSRAHESGKIIIRYLHWQKISETLWIIQDELQKYFPYNRTLKLHSENYDIREIIKPKVFGVKAEEVMKNLGESRVEARKKDGLT